MGLRVSACLLVVEEAYALWGRFMWRHFLRSHNTHDRVRMADLRISLVNMSARSPKQAQHAYPMISKIHLL